MRRYVFAILALTFSLAVAACGEEKKAKAPAADNATKTAGQEDIGRGQYLMRAGNCFTCHAETSLAALALHDLAGFSGIVRDGIKENGQLVSPVMPFIYFNGITDPDVLAMYRYVQAHAAPGQGRKKGKPVEEQYRDLAAKDIARFTPDQNRDPVWNRGAYLVTVLGHCADCHSSKEAGKAPFAGGVEKGWEAYNITPDPVAGIGAWPDGALASYLHDGTAVTGAAVGLMSVVVQNSLAYLEPGDIAAMAAYLSTLEPASDGESVSRSQRGQALPLAGVERTPMRRLDRAATAREDGLWLFNANCATCHGIDGAGVAADRPGGYPSLVHNTTVGAPNARNLVKVILVGVNRPNRAGVTSMMPAFAREFDDETMARLVNFLASQFGDPDVSLTPEDIRDLR